LTVKPPPATRHPSADAHGGGATSRQRNSIIDTPVSLSPASSSRRPYVTSAHDTTLSSGKQSYGNQIAAAAPEVVAVPAAAATMATS
jgi:hypothetical protein